MQPREWNAFVFLCVLTVLLLGLLVPAYAWVKPQPAVSVMIAVRFIEIDDASLKSIGVNFPGLPADDGTR